MNYCPQADRIIAYCWGELTVEDRENFEMHLKSCEICQHELGIERAIEGELSTEFDPGFIESKVRMRLQLLPVRDIWSFRLYTFRMAVSGISAAIAAFFLIPMLVRFLFGISPNLSQFGHSVAELLGKLAPGNAFLAIFGVGYIAVFIISMYSLTQIRR